MTSAALNSPPTSSSTSHQAASHPRSDSVARIADTRLKGRYRRVREVTVAERTNSDSSTRSEWITPKEAADYLAVGVDTIYDACAAGGLRHARIGHRTIRLKRVWVEEWAEQRSRIAR